MQGRLVINDNGEYALVIQERRDDLLLMMGRNGTHQARPLTENWRPVLEPDGGQVCFSELLPMNEFYQPDDLRYELQKIRNDLEKLIVTSEEKYAEAFGLADEVSVDLDNFKEWVKEQFEAPKEVMERMTEKYDS